MGNILGIDLTSGNKPSACIGMTLDGSICYFGTLSKLSVQFVEEIKKEGVSLIAMDAPLGFPRGMCCLEESCNCSPLEGNGRQCERELTRMGIPSYYTTKRSIIKEMIYVGIRLKNHFESLGFNVIEIYPYATKVMLFGKNLPKKTTREGLVTLRKLLVGLLPNSYNLIEGFNHDFCDAVLAAYTGLLYLQGKTIEVGCREESTIVIPKVEKM